MTDFVQKYGRWVVIAGASEGIGASLADQLATRGLDLVLIARNGPLLEEVAARHTALLEVNPGTEAALRLTRRSTPAEQGIRVSYVDAHIFADELASYGPEVRVVEPAELRTEVIARLQRARDLHAGGVS